jgi:hypothetical protein
MLQRAAVEPQSIEALPLSIVTSFQAISPMSGGVEWL